MTVSASENAAVPTNAVPSAPSRVRLAWLAPVLLAAVVYLMWDELPLAPPALWFLVATGGLFVLQAWRSLRELACYQAARSVIGTAFSADRLAAWRQSWTAQGDAANTAGEIAAVLERVAERVRDTGASAEPFVTRLRVLAGSIRCAGDDANRVSENIQYLSRSVTPSPRLRVLDVTITNALMFTGIIGTFYGLVLFLSNTEFIRLLGAFGSGNALSGLGIASILDGFRTAFGSSLVAYIGFLAGRFLVDLADEEFDETLSHLILSVESRLAFGLSTGVTVGRVDLAPSVKKLLAEQSAEMRRMVETSAEMVSATSAVSETLSRSAGELGSSLAAASSMNAELERTVARFRADLEETTKTWRRTTDDFAVAAGSASGKIADSANQLLSLQDSFSSFSKSFLSQLQGTAKLLDEQADSVRKAFGEAALAFGTKLEEAGRSVSAGVDRYGQSVGRLEGMLGATVAAQQAVQVALQDFGKTVEVSRSMSDDSYRQLVTAYGEQAAGVAAALDRLTQANVALSSSLRGIDQALLGDGEPADLTQVLQELRDALVNVPPLGVTAAAI